MQCAQGAVIELVVVDHRPEAARTVRLRAEDPRAAAAWLRSRHLLTVGATVVRPLDSESGQVTVDLVTPWGQPLQLVGRTVDASSTPRLAAE
jgi:voltage-gated potassium channel Kch